MEARDNLTEAPLCPEKMDPSSGGVSPIRTPRQRIPSMRDWMRSTATSPSKEPRSPSLSRRDSLASSFAASTFIATGGKAGPPMAGSTTCMPFWGPVAPLESEGVTETGDGIQSCHTSLNWGTNGANSLCGSGCASPRCTSVRSFALTGSPSPTALHHATVDRRDSLTDQERQVLEMAECEQWRCGRSPAPRCTTSRAILRRATCGVPSELDNNDDHFTPRSESVSRYSRTSSFGSLHLLGQDDGATPLAWSCLSNVFSSPATSPVLPGEDLRVRNGSFASSLCDSIDRRRSPAYASPSSMESAATMLARAAARHTQQQQETQCDIADVDTWKRRRTEWAAHTLRDTDAHPSQAAVSPSLPDPVSGDAKQRRADSVSRHSSPLSTRSSCCMVGATVSTVGLLHTTKRKKVVVPVTDTVIPMNRECTEEVEGRHSDLIPCEPLDGEPQIDEVALVRQQMASEEADATVTHHHEDPQRWLRMRGESPHIADEGSLARDISPPMRERSMAPAELRTEKRLRPGGIRGDTFRGIAAEATSITTVPHVVEDSTPVHKEGGGN